VKLKFIGVGTICSASYLIDEKILFDIGNGVLVRLFDNNINLAKIKCIVVSHYHSDHFADIAQFLFKRSEIVQKMEWAEQKLTIIGPKNIKRKVFALIDFFWKEDKDDQVLKLNRASNYEFIGLENSACTFEDYNIEAFTVQHYGTKDRNGYIISKPKEHYNTKGGKGCAVSKATKPTITTGYKSIGFSGDASDEVDILDNLGKANTWLIDAKYLDKFDDCHFNIGQVEKFAKYNPNKTFYAIHRNIYTYKSSLPNLILPHKGDEIEI